MAVTRFRHEILRFRQARKAAAQVDGETGRRAFHEPRCCGGGARRAGRAPFCTFSAVVAVGLLCSELPARAGADTTLETDAEALSQIFFALGGPGWQNRRGWEVLEEAREQFDDVFDIDGDEVWLCLTRVD